MPAGAASRSPSGDSGSVRRPLGYWVSMAETEFARAMKEVVGELQPLLKGHGFRKQRHTFNRECEPGLVQVVNFQMGPFDPPGTDEIPGLRENLYGKFAVNLGIFVEELHGQFSHVPRPKFVAEYYCEIRRRLGELMPGEGEYWWSRPVEHWPSRCFIGSAARGRSPSMSPRARSAADR